jgi:hypothetical protein
MKSCPECSAQYEDSVAFCPKDGRALIAKTAANTRLCPQCANSIAGEATQCPYCKAELDAVRAPQWPTREDAPLEPKSFRAGNRISIVSVVILVLGLLFFGGGLFMLLAPAQRADSTVAQQDNAKDIQEREQKIQLLESELSRVRQQLTERSEQAAELQTKLDETQKDLSTTQQRLGTTNREVERVASNRVAQTAAPPAPRPADTLSPPPPPTPASRPKQSGTYETIRATSVYEQPSGSSRVVSRIDKGTEVQVISSTGEWLEVRSRHGNPPGFLRADDARLVGQGN